LTPLNEDTHEINEKALEGRDFQTTCLWSSDTIETNIGLIPTMEYINSLTPSGYPPHALKLQIGSPIVCLRNINHHIGLVNGTKLIVKNITRNLLTAKIVSKFNYGSIVHIPRIELKVEQHKVPFIFKRLQFSVSLCYAMTINKAQGQTITGKLGLYLPAPCFSHGQLNVGTSRVTYGKNILILAPGERNNIIHNIVYPELLL
jgi:ATP-dependent DNA helicase PIF1